MLPHGGTRANIDGGLYTWGAGIDNLVFDDSGDMGAHSNVMFEGDAIFGLNPGYTFVGNYNTFDLYGGSGTTTWNDTALVATLHGGGGSNTLVGPNTNSTWNINGPNNGNLATLFFTGIQSLMGGTGVDVFTFGSAGSVLSINGGGAPAGQGDWLDYSALTTPVAVNLETGSATGVNGGGVGSVSNIQNVFGGSGGSSLTGDAQGNILVGGGGADVITGGTGRSILIGDGSAGQITGGSTSGGDILIGGTTSYDSDTSSNMTALMAILAEWQSADSYNTRFTDISTGTGPGGYELNYGTTVQSNVAVNVLTGAASALALDWFFADANDTTFNYVAGEHLNNM
jgi:hypothetical protein